MQALLLFFLFFSHLKIDFDLVFVLTLSLLALQLFIPNWRARIANLFFVVRNFYHTLKSFLIPLLFLFGLTLFFSGIAARVVIRI